MRRPYASLNFVPSLMALVYLILKSRLTGSNRAFQLQFSSRIRQGDTGLYVMDGQYLRHSSDLGLSEENFLMANGRILLPYHRSDL